MRTAEQLQTLAAELEQDWEFIQECATKNEEMAGRIRKVPESDEFAYAALGYTLHNIYNAFEGYFLRVAKFFENGLGDGGWHKTLLERMTLEIEGVRPALITKTLYNKLEKLLKFRHVFRSLYKSVLVPKKLRGTQETTDGLVKEFEAEHRRFLGFLKDAVRHLKTKTEKE